MHMLPGYKWGIKYSRVAPSFQEILGAKVIEDSSPNVAYFSDKAAAEDMLLTLSADRNTIILAQNVSYRFPNRFGSDSPIPNHRWIGSVD